MKQVNIFDYLPDNKFKFTKKIRLIEMFAGIGTQAMALKTLCKLKGHPFELYKISEWNTSATKSYHAVHYENDVTDYSKEMTKDEVLECLKKFGISSDGKKSLEEKQILRKGEKWMRDVYNDFIATHNVGSITNIHAEDLGIVETDKYEYLFCYSFPCQDLSLAGKRAGMEKGSGTRSGLLWEVERLLKQCDELPTVLLMENVTQVHGTKNQKSWAQWLEALEEMGYRNYWMDMNSKMYGIPQNRNRTIMISILGDYNYEFVKGFPLKIRLKDMLEDEVDEKYYISEKPMRCFDSKGTGKYPKLTISNKYFLSDAMKRYIVSHDEKFITNDKSNIINKSIASPVTTREGLTRCYSSSFECPELRKEGKEEVNITNMDVTELRLRKLTPRECGRLMGVSDDDIKKMMKIHSDSQLYKQFGNAIVTNVLFYALLPLF